MYNGSATVTWSPNSESDLAGYRVYKGLAPTHYDGFLVTVSVLQLVRTVK